MLEDGFNSNCRILNLLGILDTASQTVSKKEQGEVPAGTSHRFTSVFRPARIPQA
jgi:hypothetical protein